MAIAETLIGIAQDKNEMKSQDNLNGEAFPVFKLFTEEMSIHNSVVLETRSIGSSGFILGSGSSGILGTSTLGGLSTIFSKARVIHDKNQYIDDFSNYDYTSTLTTATKVSNTWDIGSGDALISGPIFLNNQEIYSANITLEANTPGTLDIYLSNNGGSTWESVETNTEYIFTSTGSDLRYKIEGVGIVDKIVVKYAIN